MSGKGLARDGRPSSVQCAQKQEPAKAPYGTAKGRCATAQILFPEGQNSYIGFASL